MWQKILTAQLSGWDATRAIRATFRLKKHHFDEDGVRIRKGLLIS